MIRYVPIKRWVTLEEDLTLSDLNRNQAISDFTKPFRKQTSALLGKSTSVVKLVDAKLDVENDWITYYFLTEYTPHYKKGQSPEEVDPNNMELKPTKTYEIWVRIMGVLEWIDTYDMNYPIKIKDLKDILKVASIKWWSSVPSFQFMGSNYILTTFNAAIFDEIRPDNYWKKYTNSDNFLDKHSVGVANTILSFWINPMSSMLNKQLKDKKII